MAVTVAFDSFEVVFAYSFSPLHEMPDIFRHFMKCLTSRIVCNIYIVL